MAGERFEDYRCDGCGMAWSDHTPDELASTARDIAPRWRDIVRGVDDDVLSQRPNPGDADGRTWSAKQYGWHIGSVLEYMATSIARMAEGDDVELDYYDHEADVDDADADTREVAELTARIDGSSSRLGEVLQELDDTQWEHEADFPWGRRDVLDMARNAVHEGEHHLQDVEQVIAAVGASRQRR